jgi:hypothetical protein
MAVARLALLLATALLLGSGCGKKDVTVLPPDPASERADAPVPPPRGWTTHENAPAGFTIALPRSWTAAVRDGTTRVRSADGSVVVSLQADRSEAGRTTPASEYALATLEALPGYRDLEGRPAQAPRSPYDAARAAGSGTRTRGDRRQRVSVTVFRRPPASSTAMGRASAGT